MLKHKRSVIIACHVALDATALDFAEGWRAEKCIRLTGNIDRAPHVASHSKAAIRDLRERRSAHPLREP